MNKYRVLITFSTDEIFADNEVEVNAKVNDLLDQLELVNTKLGWSSVDWVILEDTEPAHN